MKTKLILLSQMALLSTIALSQTDSQYPFEDQMMRTISEFYISEGIRINHALDSVEADLIRMKLLPDGTGQGYHSALTNIINEEFTSDPSDIRFGAINPYELYGMAPFIPLQIWPGDTLSMTLFPTSGFSVFIGKLEYMILNSSGNHKPHPKEYALLEALSTTDMEHPFYQYLMIWLILDNLVDNPYEAYMQPSPETVRETPLPEVQKPNELSIYLKGSGHLMVNHEPSSLTNLERKLEELLVMRQNQVEISIDTLGTYTGPDITVFLRKDEATSYDLYSMLVESIDAVYLKLRERKAHEVFGKALTGLSAAERNLIHRLIPKNVIETTE